MRKNVFHGLVCHSSHSDLDAVPISAIHPRCRAAPAVRLPHKFERDLDLVPGELAAVAACKPKLPPGEPWNNAGTGAVTDWFTL